MNPENARISPSWEGVLEDLQKKWSKEALLRGREEGKLEGKLEEKKEANLQFAKRLLRDNYPVETIIKLTDLTMKDIQKNTEE